MPVEGVTKGQDGAMSFVRPKAVDYYLVCVLASGLKLFKDTGIRPNRAWTPGRMMAKAGEITGKKFKARDYQGALEALEEKKKEMRK